MKLSTFFNAEVKFKHGCTLRQTFTIARPDTNIYTVFLQQTKNKSVHFPHFLYLVEFIKTAFSWLKPKGKWQTLLLFPAFFFVFCFCSENESPGQVSQAMDFAAPELSLSLKVRASCTSDYSTSD